MQIRYGYELEFFCPQAVEMVGILDAHPEHAHKVRQLGEFYLPLVSIRAVVDFRARRQINAHDSLLALYRGSNV